MNFYAFVGASLAFRGAVILAFLPAAIFATDTVVTWGPSTTMVTTTVNSPRYSSTGASLDLTTPLTATSGYTGPAIYGGVDVSSTLTLTALRMLNNHSSFGAEGGVNHDVFDLRNIDPTPTSGVMTALVLWENPYFPSTYTTLPSGLAKNLARLRYFSYTGGYSPNSISHAYFVIRYEKAGSASGYMISPVAISANRLESNGGTHVLDAKTAVWYDYEPTTGVGLANISTTTAIADPNLIVEGVTHVGMLFQMNGKSSESALSFYKFSVTAEKWRKKAPFKALYNNDTGNVELFDMAQSASNFEEGKFNSAKLEFSIDEFYDAIAPSGGPAPFAAYMISPGYGHVPLWRSNFIDPDDHLAWWRYAHPMSGVQKLSAIGDYMDPNPAVDEDGGNVVAEVVDRCDDFGMASFVSFRPNDYHRAEDIDARPGLWDVALFGDLSNNLWRYEHPQYRVARAPLSTRPEYRYWDTNPATADHDLHTPGTWTQQSLATALGAARQATCMNWHIPQVRDQMFALINDVLTRNPGLSGLELDFPRYLNYFPAISGTITSTERARRVLVMTEFVSRVRRLLDLQGRKLNRNYWLSVRLPHTESEALGADPGNDVNGLDAGMLANAGVDIFVFCSRSSTHRVQVGVRNGLDPDLKEIADEVKAENLDAALYYELTYLAGSGSAYDSGGAQTANYRWSATREQLKTIMHLAYNGSGDIPGSSPTKPWPVGIDGYSLYNFAYYRLADAPPGSATVKSEPSFDILADLMSPTAVAASPQHYLRATNDINPDHATNRTFTLVLRKPSTNSGQWVGNAQLRLHSLAALPSGVTISVTLNGSGTPLSTATLTTPFPQGSIPQFSSPEANPSQHILQWTVNTANLVEGVNTFTVTKTGTGTVSFRYADLSIP